jgi:hypothetical protein
MPLIVADECALRHDWDQMVNAGEERRMGPADA